MKTVQADGIDIGLESKQFTMKANAKAFAILSSGLYSNKVRAVVRELSCNAHDSHIEAGTADKPFDVKLPDWHDNTFYVRDYGTGLTEEEIYNVYTTYFESTKSNSNEYTGALGLGSKSPFCLTDTFTIEAFKDNMLRTFVAFIGKSGMPEISKVSEEETIQPNGLKVSFTSGNDHSSYLNEARDLFRWFPVTPTVINSDFTVKEVKVESKLTDTVSVLGAEAFGYAERMFVKQGTVAYPLKSSDLNTYFEDYGFLEYMYLQLEVPLGQVDVTASREAISFNEATINNLSKYFHEVKELIDKDIEKDLTKCEGNPWKLAERVQKLNKMYPSELVSKSSIILNHPLAESEYKTVTFSFKELDYITKKEGVVTVTEFSTFNGKIRTTVDHKQKLPKSYSKTYIATETYVIVNDTNRGSLPTLRLFSKNHRVTKFILIDFNDRKKYNTRVVNSILKDLENPTNVLYTSKMERPQSTRSNIPGSPAKPKELTIQRFTDPLCQYTGKLVKELYKEEKADKMYFVDLDNHTILDNELHLNCRGLAGIIKSTIPSEFFKGKIVCGLTKTQRKLFDKAGIERKSLFTAFEDYINDLDLTNILSSQNVINEVPAFINNSTFKLLIDKGLCSVPEIVQLVNISSSNENTSNVSIRHIKNTIRSLDINISLDIFDDLRENSKNTNTDLIKFAHDITEVCPMLEYFRAGWGETEQAYTVLLDYINNQYA